VSRVVDGDTVEISPAIDGVEEVRLIGVDTPETVDRHTFTTLWLESGGNPKVLQEILGHSRIDVTLNVYSHVLPHIQHDAMDRFGRRFFGRS
jgi:hypothetical protein